MPTVVYLLRDSFLLISLLHFALFSFSVFQIVSWKELMLNPMQKKLAALLIFFPFVCSTVLFSPVNQLSASLCLGFFSLGLLLEKRYKKTRLQTLAVNASFLASLLSYEISIPLLFVHYLVGSKSRRSYLSSNYAFFVLLTILFVWQKVLAPSLFDSDFSRLSGLNSLTFLSYFVSYFVSVPMVFAFGFIDYFPVVLVIASALWVLVNFRSSEMKFRGPTRFVQVTLMLAFLSNSVFFLLSDRYALINGYQNRGLSTSWILISILAVTFFRKDRYWLAIFILIFVSVNTVLFAVKVQDAVSAGNIRLQIISSIAESTRMVQVTYPNIIIDTPCNLPNSNFRTEIFCTSWDAKGALANVGLNYENVLVTGDPDFAYYLSKLPSTDKSVIFRFGTNFEVLKAEMMSSKSRKSLLSVAEARASRADASIADCEARLLAITDLEFSGGPARYLECARDPFPAN
jgi:hypothetical protein